MNSAYVFGIIILAFFIGTAGCIGNNQQENVPAPSWNLTPDGSVAFTVPPISVHEQVIEKNENLTVTDLNFSGFAGDVHAILVHPQNPTAFLVWAPGANNPASGYLEYMKFYPGHDIGVLILDVRGNGGKTPGYPMNIEHDVDLFMQGEWPQFYLIATDMISARMYLNQRYQGIPVYAVGDSNGGRYAALAAGSDPEFAGYIGISTSGFHRAGDAYNSPIREFLLSIDPDVQVRNMSTEAVTIFHAPDDPIIPYADGQELARNAGKKAQFIPFNGTHGVNREVDGTIITLISQSPGGAIQDQP